MNQTLFSTKDSVLKKGFIGKITFGLCLGLAVVLPAHRVVAGPHELGLALGTPSQLAYQYNGTAATALNFGLAFDTNHFVYVSGDHHWKLEALKLPAVLAPYVGLGAFVAVHTQSYGDTTDTYWGTKNPASVIAVRIPVGLEYRPPQAPLTVYGEIAPSLTVAPATSGLFQMLIGLRYQL